jgi:hypothetical protein
VCSIAEFDRVKMTNKEPLVVKFEYKNFTLVNENEEAGSSQRGKWSACDRHCYKL